MHTCINMHTDIHAHSKRVNMHTYIIKSQDEVKMSSKMPTNIRLTKDEQREIEIKCRELNKTLINQDIAPIQESELVHIILKMALKRLKLNKSGDFDLE